MARLPKVGDDKGTWGGILNDYLSESHKDDGTLKNDTVGAAQLRPQSVTSAAIANGAVTAAKLASGTAPTNGQSLTYDGTGLSWATVSGSGPLPDATDSDKGLVRLAGDLAGTATTPLIADEAITAAKLQDGSITDAKVATNASIAMSKISGLTPALDGKASTSDLLFKADDDAVVHLNGSQTINGTKTFALAPVIPDAAFTLAKTIGLEPTLDGHGTRLTSLEASAARIVYSETPPASLPTGYVWGQVLTTPPADLTPPSAPVLADITLDDGKPSLSWSASSDPSGISHYNVYRDGLILAVSPTTAYIDTSAAGSTTYIYTVTAIDSSPAANESAASNSKSVATPAPSFLGRADLAVAFDPNTLTGANGTAISEILQSAGFLSCTLTQANSSSQPILNTSGLNGRKTLVFSSASSQFIQGGLSSALTGPTTTFIVFRATVPASTTRSILSGINSSPYRGVGIATTASTARVRALAAGSGNVFSSSATHTQNVWRIVAVVQNPDGTGILYDHSRTGESFTLPDGSTLGSSMTSIKLARAAGSSSTYTDMEWAGAFVFNSAFSAAEVGQGISYIEGLTGLSAGA